MQGRIQLERNQRWAPNGPMDYARSARRYKFGHTPYAPMFYSEKLGVVLRRDDKSVTEDLTGHAVVQAQDIQNDQEYICPVTIGSNPGVTLKLDFDTGSADLWVWSSEYRGVQSPEVKHTMYNPSESTTSQKAEGLTWEIGYGDGSAASGDVYFDKVDIGGITISNQAVEVAKELSASFLDDMTDGLLGLALSGNTVKGPQGDAPQKTPVQNMIDQKLLKQPVFTTKLDKHDSNGFYTFGYIDTSVTKNPILYTDVISSNGFWEFPSAALKVGSTPFQRANNNTAIADTGTTLILLDDDTLAKLYGAIPGAHLDENRKYYIFPTSNADSLPDISFAVGENMFSIPGKDLVHSDAEDHDGMSFGSIQSRGTNPQDIFGDVFLKRVYAVFELGETPRIGFAQRDD